MKKFFLVITLLCSGQLFSMDLRNGPVLVANRKRSPEHSKHYSSSYFQDQDSIFGDDSFDEDSEFGGENVRGLFVEDMNSSEEFGYELQENQGSELWYGGSVSEKDNERVSEFDDSTRSESESSYNLKKTKKKQRKKEEDSSYDAPYEGFNALSPRREAELEAQRKEKRKLTNRLLRKWDKFINSSKWKDFPWARAKRKRKYPLGAIYMGLAITVEMSTWMPTDTSLARSLGITHTELTQLRDAEGEFVMPSKILVETYDNMDMYDPENGRYIFIRTTDTLFNRVYTGELEDYVVLGKKVEYDDSINELDKSSQANYKELEKYEDDLDNNIAAIKALLNKKPVAKICKKIIEESSIGDANEVVTKNLFEDVIAQTLDEWMKKKEERIQNQDKQSVLSKDDVDCEKNAIFTYIKAIGEDGDEIKSALDKSREVLNASFCSLSNEGKGSFSDAHAWNKHIAASAVKLTDSFLSTFHRQSIAFAAREFAESVVSKGYEKLIDEINDDECERIVIGGSKDKNKIKERLTTWALRMTQNFDGKNTTKSVKKPLLESHKRVPRLKKRVQKRFVVNKDLDKITWNWDILNTCYAEMVKDVQVPGVTKKDKELKKEAIFTLMVCPCKAERIKLLTPLYKSLSAKYKKKCSLEVWVKDTSEITGAFIGYLKSLGDAGKIVGDLKCNWFALYDEWARSSRNSIKLDESTLGRSSKVILTPNDSAREKEMAIKYLQSFSEDYSWMEDDYESMSDTYKEKFNSQESGLRIIQQAQALTNYKENKAL